MVLIDAMGTVLRQEHTAVLRYLIIDVLLLDHGSRPPEDDSNTI